MNKLMAIFPCALLALSVNAATTNQDHYTNMHKQLSIMSDIIKSSVGVQEGRKNAKITAIDSVYLDGQGVVFTISSGSRNRSWGNYNFNFVMPEVPALPPLPTKPVSGNRNRDSDDERFDIEINETVADALESATEGYERAMEALEEERDQSRDLRNEQRDLSYQIRDLEREKRDLEYQARRADKASKAQLQKQAKKLDERKKAIEQHRKELAAKTTELRQHQQAKQKQKAKERTSFYQGLSVSLAETLCLYGNGLKALPKDENVSVIIKSGGEKEGRRYKDKIYVFSKKDINACSTDKIDVAKLVERGKGYQF